MATSNIQDMVWSMREVGPDDLGLLKEDQVLTLQQVLISHPLNPVPSSFHLASPFIVCTSLLVSEIQALLVLYSLC